MKSASGWDFWRFCFRLGARESIRGLDYFRFYEYPAFHANLDLTPDCSVLDLGCGRGLFPLYCAFRGPNLRYTTVDIDGGAIDWQRRMAQRLGGLPNLNVLLGDSTRLDLPDNSFDRVANLGSIEHIPGEGDLETAAQMGRVCRPGGKLVLSIPYATKGGELGTTSHWHGFERRYDDRMLEERIVGPSGCDVVSIVHFGEKGVQFSKKWYPLPFVVKLPFRHLAPLASRMWLTPIRSEDRHLACGVQVVLKKPLR